MLTMVAIPTAVSFSSCEPRLGPAVTVSQDPDLDGKLSLRRDQVRLY